MTEREYQSVKDNIQNYIDEVNKWLDFDYSDVRMAEERLLRKIKNLRNKDNKDNTPIRKSVDILIGKEKFTSYTKAIQYLMMLHRMDINKHNEQIINKITIDHSESRLDFSDGNSISYF